MSAPTRIPLALRTVAVLGVLIVLLALSVAALAHSSPNFDATWSRLASGGGARQSSNYLAQDILGQWLTQSPASGGARIVTDFYAAEVVGTQTRVYIPLIAR